MSRLPKTTLLAAAVFTLLPLAAHAQGQPRPPALPEGAGKSIAEGVCTLCHQTNMITGALGYTKDGWKELISTMADLTGAPNDLNTLTDYLAANFPPHTRKQPKLVSGPTEVT